MRQLFALVIRAYQVALSPLGPPCCRFVPSCSSYGREAILTHGAFAGGLLLLWRLCRCHPFGGHGYDPVPKRLPWQKPLRAAKPSGARS